MGGDEDFGTQYLAFFGVNEQLASIGVNEQSPRLGVVEQQVETLRKEMLRQMEIARQNAMQEIVRLRNDVELLRNEVAYLRGECASRTWGFMPTRNDASA